MITPRWKKVLSDLVSNPTRTLLVVLSIFVGVFAVGLVTGAEAILVREMNASYYGANPATATISVPDQDSFDNDLVQTIRSMSEVGAAEGRRTFSARVRGPYDDWIDIQFIAIDDFQNVTIDSFQFQEGSLPPPYKTLLMERSGLEKLGASLGDVLTIERPDERQRQISISGIVYAPTTIPASFGPITTYVTRETMQWLSGESSDFNQLLILSADGAVDDVAHNQYVAELVYDRVRKSGRDPAFPNISDGEHPLSTFINAMVAILSAMGIMSVFLSAFLMTNTISALLAQQAKQIGIMKTIGARTYQIILMYLVLVLAFGGLALLLAYPLSLISMQAFAELVGGFFNIAITDRSVPLSIIITQSAISLGVPVIAAIYPVLSGANITIREAISAEGGAGSYGTSVIDRIIQRIQGLPRPILLSLRNTFRRKGRVTLTLLTLTLGGAIFIAIFGIRTSLAFTFEGILESLFNYDVSVNLVRDYRSDYLVNEALSIPGVVEAETWRVSGTRRMLPDGSESDTITLWGIPPESNMVRPTLIRGRWLLPDDENAIVLSNGVFANAPDDITLGDEIILRIKGRNTTWRIVGEVATIGSVPWAYVNAEYYGHASRNVGTAANLYIQTEPRDAETQQQVTVALDEHFSRLGIGIVSTDTGASIRQQQSVFIDAIVGVLLGMSVLIAFVGGLGLMGTMSLNVLERIREIGVMRAIGASDGKVLQIVMVEGIALGLMSWILGALLSFPLSKLLSDQVGMLLFSFPLSFQFSPAGAVLWLFISLSLAALASFLPAWRASRVTVRDVLAYE